MSTTTGLRSVPSSRNWPATSTGSAASTGVAPLALRLAPVSSIPLPLTLPVSPTVPAPSFGADRRVDGGHLARGELAVVRAAGAAHDEAGCHADRPRRTGRGSDEARRGRQRRDEEEHGDEDGNDALRRVEVPEASEPEHGPRRMQAPVRRRNRAPEPTGAMSRAAERRAASTRRASPRPGRRGVLTRGSGSVVSRRNRATARRTATVAFSNTVS